MLYTSNMAIPILSTKLYIPPPPPMAVLRPRLAERLNDILHRKLTLISAPAGFGKTTLVSAWIASCNCPVAWLSLEDGDNDPVRFLTYVVSAIQTIDPHIGETLLTTLQSSQPPPIDSILVALLNELTAIKSNFVLVLDDYHVLDAPSIDHALTFLLEHQPTQMHLVITTREDPQLPLPRLRARGQLTELRAVDLRFTSTETSDFLHTMGLDLSAGDIDALEARTEGWIAGLQLAALSMQGHRDIPAFIRSFAGDHRYIVDYLVEEVLDRQPPSVRNFLLQTSILDRLCGSLCDAVTEQQSGTARLETLERGNFFVVPLDDRRQWYRYHHLFAEVLYTHLVSEQSDQLSALHRRASEWYEQNGSSFDAIRHALAARDFNRAANLIEMAVPEMRKHRQEALLFGWLKALPEELFHFRPVLNVNYAGVLLAVGKPEGVEARLKDAERWLDPGADRAELIILNEAEFRQLPSAIAMFRAGQSLVQGDVLATVKYARQVLDLATPDEPLLRGAASALMGLAYWASGDLDAAHRSFAEGMAGVQKAGFISDAVGGAIALADIRIIQGRLREAMRTYEQALQLAADHGDPDMRGTADMYVGMSEIHLEHNELDAALQSLLAGKKHGEHIGFPQNPYRWRVAMSRIRQAQGDFAGALTLLNEAGPLYVSDFFPNVRPLAALRARLRIAQGNLDEAQVWANAQVLSTKDDLHYLREFEHITLAKLLLAQYKLGPTNLAIGEILAFLDRLLKAAEEGGRTGSVIEILILQSLALYAQGNTNTALIPLQRALSLADPEGYVRIFVDEGASMSHLLGEATVRGILPAYSRKLLLSFEPEQPKSPDKPASSGASSTPLVDPLSERELDVLKLLATDLNGPEIANALTISLSTMRTHTRNIYEKLGADNRRAAVRRAQELHLL